MEIKSYKNYLRIYDSDNDYEIIFYFNEHIKKLGFAEWFRDVRTGKWNGFWHGWKIDVGDKNE